MCQSEQDSQARIEALSLVGFETQTHETKTFATGIPRVIRETHGWASDFLGAAGVNVGWTNTVVRPRSYGFQTDPYLASDPVLNAPQAHLSEIDVLVVIDIPQFFDVRSVQSERQSRQLKVLVLIHDILPITHPEWFPAESGKHFRLYLQRMLHIADHVIVTTQFVKEELLRLGWSTGGKIHVIGLGSFHSQRPPSVVPESQISLLCVSTVEPRKGHQRLIGAFDELRRRGHDVSLDLVGKRGWAEEQLYEEIQNHPDFGGRIKWHRDASDEQVSALASHSNIGVIPSDEEGFGMFLEEAITLGLKVVASDIPVFRERAQSNLFFAPLSAEGLAEGILEAAGAPWQTVTARPVRTMRDFACDFSNLVLEITGSRI
jgi:glycosyltransferase involved in cell wall biosynthesis